MSFFLDASPSVFLLIVLGGITFLVIAWLWIAGFFAPRTFEPPSAVPSTNASLKSNTTITLQAAVTATSPVADQAGERRLASAFAATTATAAVSRTIPAKQAEATESFSAELSSDASYNRTVLPEQTQGSSVTRPAFAPTVSSEPASLVVAPSNPVAPVTVEIPLSTAPKLRPWQQRTPPALLRRRPLGEQTTRLLHWR